MRCLSFLYPADEAVFERAVADGATTAVGGGGGSKSSAFFSSSHRPSSSHSSSSREREEGDGSGEREKDRSMEGRDKERHHHHHHHSKRSSSGISSSSSSSSSSGKGGRDSARDAEGGLGHGCSEGGYAIPLSSFPSSASVTLSRAPFHAVDSSYQEEAEAEADLYHIGLFLLFYAWNYNRF